MPAKHVESKGRNTSSRQINGRQVEIESVVSKKSGSFGSTNAWAEAT